MVVRCLFRKKKPKQHSHYPWCPTKHWWGQLPAFSWNWVFLTLTGSVIHGVLDRYWWVSASLRCSSIKWTDWELTWRARKTKYIQWSLELLNVPFPREVGLWSEQYKEAINTEKCRNEGCHWFHLSGFCLLACFETGAHLLQDSPELAV